MFLISSMHVWVICFCAAPRYSRGLKFSGVVLSDWLMAAVAASLKSLSTLILQMFISVARRSCSVGMPRAFDSFPPFLFIVSVRCDGMFDAPCSTNGKFGMRLAISPKISNRNSSLSLLRLYAPWLVPMAIAKESVLVADTNFSMSSGLV